MRKVPFGAILGAVIFVTSLVGLLGAADKKTKTPAPAGAPTLYKALIGLKVYPKHDGPQPASAMPRHFRAVVESGKLTSYRQEFRCEVKIGSDTYSASLSQATSAPGSGYHFFAGRLVDDGVRFGYVSSFSTTVTATETSDSSMTVAEPVYYRFEVLPVSDENALKFFLSVDKDAETYPCTIRQMP